MLNKVPQQTKHPTDLGLLTDQGGNRPGMPNRPGLRNKPTDQGRSGSFNRQFNPNRSEISIDLMGISGKRVCKKDGFNRPGTKFNRQKPTGIRKPVSPNEFLQIQKTNKSIKIK